MAKKYLASGAKKDGGQKGASKILEIDPMSAAKHVGILYFMLGTTLAICIFLLSLIQFNELLAPFGFPFRMLPRATPFLAALPFFYAITGAIAAAIAALFYNAIAARTGGLSVKIG